MSLPSERNSFPAGCEYSQRILPGLLKREFAGFTPPGPARTHVALFEA